MSLKKRAICGSFIIALIASTGVGVSASAATNKKKETVVVELRIKGFSGPIIAKVPLGDLMGKFGAGGHSHHPDEIPGGYSYSISARRLRRGRASVAINLTLTFRGGAEKQIKGRMLIRRNKPSEAEYDNGVKVKAYFEAAPNNGMHPTANSAALMRETCFNSAARRGG